MTRPARSLALSTNNRAAATGMVSQCTASDSSDYARRLQAAVWRVMETNITRRVAGDVLFLFDWRHDEAYRRQ